MRQLALAMFAVSISITNPIPAAAQISELQPGARIRVQAPGIVAGKYEGTVLTRSADSIVVGGPSVRPIPLALARITSIEVSRGSSRSDGAIRGMKWGVPIMAAFGAILGTAAVANDSCRNCYPHSAADVVEVTTYFALSGAFYGAGIGALIGRERWEGFDIGTRTSLELRGGRIGAGLQVGF